MLQDLNNDDLLKIYRATFDNAYDIILYLSEEGNILAANKMAVEKYGYTYEELLSMNIRDLRHFTTKYDYEDQMTLSKSGGLLFECTHVSKHGTAFPVEVSSRTIEFNNHRIRIHIIRDITDRKKIEDKIVYLAKYDPLTNIPNRANIISQLDDAIKEAEFDQENLAFLIFDLDKFKMINDTFGHPTGDKVLQYVASTVQGLLRPYDSVGRFGGDEFVIILRKIKGHRDVLSVVNRIFDVFKSPTILEDNHIQISISIGICLLSEAKNRDSLIYQADTAMYEAKKTLGCSSAFYANIPSNKKNF